MWQKNLCSNTVNVDCCLNSAATSMYGTFWNIYSEDNHGTRRISSDTSGRLSDTLRTTASIEIKNTTQVIWCELRNITTSSYDITVSTCNYQRFLIINNCTGKFYR